MKQVLGAYLISGGASRSQGGGLASAAPPPVATGLLLLGIFIKIVRVESDADLLPELGDLLLRLVPNELAVHIASNKHGDLSQIIVTRN